jgi:AraC-like DNA-binding protein
MRKPAVRQSADVQFALWEAAVVVSGDPAIGLRVGQQLGRKAVQHDCAWLQSVTSVRELLRVKGLPLRVDDRATSDASDSPERARLTLSSRERSLPDQAIDCVFGALFAAIPQVFSQTAASDFSVSIAHPAHSPLATYERYLGCRVELDAEQHAIEGPRACLEPAEAGPNGTPRADAAAPCGRLVASVRAQLVRQLEQGCLGLSVLAHALHLSERTLRRRLSEQGTSYQLLLDELRARTACELVQAGAQSLDAISVRLGFADPACFFHAFKRWTGKTPMQFRRERRAPSDA